MSGKKRAETLKLIFDSNALITMCKFSYQSNPLVGIITDLCEVTIPRSVAKETTRAKERFSDARIAAEFIRSEKIEVDDAETSTNTFLDDYKLGKGEKEAIFLYLAKEKELDCFVTDDRLVHIVCDRMGIPKSLFLDLIIKLVNQSAMEADLAKRIIELIKPRYSKGFVSHSLVLLEEVKESVKAENFSSKEKGD